MEYRTIDSKPTQIVRLTRYGEWVYRSTARTPACHAGDRGSIPLIPAMSKRIKILLAIVVAIVIGLMLARMGTASEEIVITKDNVIKLDDDKCHGPYDDPDDCRHPCDHIC